MSYQKSGRVFAAGRPEGLATPVRPKLGVIGGMGPLATIDLLRKIVTLTPAQRDQDHLPLLVYADPQTPDRSEAIAGSGPSPLPHLLEAVRVLDGAGAALIAIACNTAHYWHAQLQSSTKLPILNIVHVAVRELQAMPLQRGAVGVLATTGALRAGIFQTAFAGAGLRLLEPLAHEQQALMSYIRAVKAGACHDDPSLVARIGASLCSRGAEAVLLACTELPLLVRQGGVFVDATAALARACVREIAAVESER